MFKEKRFIYQESHAPSEFPGNSEDKKMDIKEAKREMEKKLFGEKVPFNLVEIEDKMLKRLTQGDFIKRLSEIKDKKQKKDIKEELVHLLGISGIGGAKLNNLGEYGTDYIEGSDLLEQRAEDPSTHPFALECLAELGLARITRRVANNPNTPTETLIELSRDIDGMVSVPAKLELEKRKTK